MIITYLILKLTLDGILKECNRIALEQELHERGRWFKTRLAKLEMDYEKGLIDTETYNRIQDEILAELSSLSGEDRAK